MAICSNLRLMPGFTKISITQFKNYDFASFSFTERVVGICGLNGKGKTNLLDAIYYLCFTKSYFSRTDAANTRFDKEGYRLEGLVNGMRVMNDAVISASTGVAAMPATDQVVCIFRGTGKKEFSFNGIPYSKYSAHIGKYPCVMIAPDDIELITGGSEARRKYIDTLLSQLDADYLQQLIIYTRVLLQRNSLLKRFADTGHTDWALLEVIDDQLLVPGKYIYAARKKLTIELIPLVNRFYHLIADNEEVVTLQYESQLNQGEFETVLNQYREKDFILQRTNGGIHKDDIILQLNGLVFKTIASQGQRKSLLFALKLAEFELLKNNKGFPPILLLDDVFEKLDALRMQHLLSWVCNANAGQVFITDTHRERLESAFQTLGIPFQLIAL